MVICTAIYARVSSVAIAVTRIGLSMRAKELPILGAEIKCQV